MAFKSLGRLAGAIGLLLLLSACATVNQTVPLKNEFWSQTDRTVTVALAKLPDTQAHKAGAQGLLDIAINEAMADELTKALKTITLNNSYGAARSEVVIRQFRDGFLPEHWAEVKEFLESLKAVRPDLILTTHRHDRHQDHRLIAELTWNTFRDHLIAEYEIFKYEGDLGHPNFYVPLPEATMKRKIGLILRHFPSQGGRRWFRAENFEALLRLRGIECNAPEGFAEAFHVSKLVI